MRFFLTGATGFLGSHLVDQLLDEGHEVVALVRPTSETGDLPDPVELVEGDLTEKESMRAGMDGVDGVFHLAAWYRVGDPDPNLAERVNVQGTRNVLELVGELRIPRAVYTSTLAVNSDTKGRVVDESYRYDGPHLSVYDRTKWQAHYEVARPMAEKGLPVIILQPGLIYGPGDRGPLWPLWKAYLERSLPAIPRRTAYSWGHVEDVARAHRLAMDDGTPGRSYVVAGESRTLVEALEVAEAITGISAPPAVPPVLFRVMARATALVEPFVDLPAMYEPEALRVVGGATYLGDSTRARRELGLRHRPLEEGLREMLEVELDRMEH